MNEGVFSGFQIRIAVYGNDTPIFSEFGKQLSHWQTIIAFTFVSHLNLFGNLSQKQLQTHSTLRVESLSKKGVVADLLQTSPLHTVPHIIILCSKSVIA